MQRIHPRDADLRGRVTRGKERAGDDLNPVPAQASSAAAGRRIEIGLDCRRRPAVGRRWGRNCGGWADHGGGWRRG